MHDDLRAFTDRELVRERDALAKELAGYLPPDNPLHRLPDVYLEHDRTRVAAWLAITTALREIADSVTGRAPASSGNPVMSSMEQIERIAAETFKAGGKTGREAGLLAGHRAAIRGILSGAVMGVVIAVAGIWALGYRGHATDVLPGLERPPPLPRALSSP